MEWNYVTFDFETDAIEPRPKYPPKPVGLALLLNKESQYHAWGHPTGNCANEGTVRELVHSLTHDKSTWWIAHNLAFDASIIEEKWNVKFPWERSSDTMLLAFLHNPYGELSLKPLAERYLGLPPEEQEAVRQWLVARGICRSNDKNWGACIAKAPGDLVGKYAIGDVIRTKRLFDFYRTQLPAPPQDSKVPHNRDTSPIRA